jgi:ubiquinone/menaquinone biosynthesis C-methylase UbiE
LPSDMQREERNLFDVGADLYDLWFESRKGKAIFEIEKTCLQVLLRAQKGRWLEVGVGSGRFASFFDISEGIDPSSGMLAIAAQRGIRTVRGVGEDLPYRDAAFDGVLMVTTLCFVTDVKRTLSECHRVLRPNGRFILAIVPAESEWGQLYKAKGQAGHPLYSYAKFYTCNQVICICAERGFVFEKALCCLKSAPGEEPIPNLEEGIDESAGFVAMRFQRDSVSEDSKTLCKNE